MSGKQSGAQLLVRTLEAQGVEHVFGIPGAKIDPVFNALLDSPIKTVVCRHEQNAAFIAGGMGRITGKAGVVLVTSGPGCSNLVTGLATANTEGDPIVALGGAVPIADRLKQTHQSMDTVAMFRPVTKYAAEIDAGDAVSEALATAFRAAESGRPGAAFLSLPKDVMKGPAPDEVLTPARCPALGPADAGAIAEAARLIEAAERPVVVLGMLASQPAAANAIRALLVQKKLAIAGTFQAAGVVPREHVDCFGGRVGLFHNQPADRLLDAADLVLTIGFDPVEYDPALWNAGRTRKLIHLDCVPADPDRHYRPDLELLGDIAATLWALAPLLKARPRPAQADLLAEIAAERTRAAAEAVRHAGMPVHPMRIVQALQAIVDQDTTLCVDMGSFHIWLARHLLAHRPRQILISNGQQTLGVGLPWAIGACLADPGRKVVSVSGDGGFLFSAVELETAVRLKCNFVHIVWIDGHYDMVRFQEMAAYGRDSGVTFGPVDVVKFAESMGARGFAVTSPDEVAPVLAKAMAMEGPVLIGVPVDYSGNQALMAALHPDVIH
ncbi:acetolactate synthase AlsS [Reyranella sp.]|uniref:acetolactate synthase AlsS n=1 Tax=Reyranella sp. TaxID=1929291 RepID=UPI003BA9284D